MLLDNLRNLFMEALSGRGRPPYVLIEEWNKEVNRIQEVFDRMTDKERPKQEFKIRASDSDAWESEHSNA